MVHYTKNPLIDETIPASIKRLLESGITHYIVIKDGHILAHDLNQIEGLYFENFDEALSTHKQAIETIHTYNTNHSDAYQYMMEDCTSGLFLRVDKNVTVDGHLHLFIVQEEHDLIHNTVVVMEPNSALQITQHLSNINPSSANVVNQYHIKDNAQLNVTSLSLFNQKSVQNVIHQGYVEHYGRLVLNNAEVSDALSETLTQIKLLNPYSSATVKTVALTNGVQSCKFEQYVEHLAKDTEGYIENYGVSSDESCLVFEGVGKIHKGMKQSIARQSNKGIVLDAESRLDANPLLLIDEYDVIASHGAAIGQIDEEQLYYLMSRGLSQKDAERLIINGFLSPIMESLSSETLKTVFLESVQRKTSKF
jgi:Fe-S cluster assembly protein SufD